eukprot:49972-Eustigmatos_ZCMA.PRE.1
MPASALPHLLVQFSDTHIAPPGSLAYGRVDTAAHLVRHALVVITPAGLLRFSRLQSPLPLLRAP